MTFKVHEEIVTTSAYCQKTNLLISGSRGGVLKLKSVKDLEVES